MITEQSIDLNTFLAHQPDTSCGGVATFTGIVRNHHKGRSVEKLYYECYTSMAEKEMGRITQEVKLEFGVHELRVLHRVGWLDVGEAAIAIWVSAAHRKEAFSACRATIDRIKARVPIWKKEIYVDGTSDWVLCTHQEVEVLS